MGRPSGLAQASYFMPTMPGPGDDFSDVAEIEPIRFVPDGEYFGRLGISVNETLELPANLAALVDAVDALPAGDRDRFFRSAYWFSRAGGAWRLSQSLSYISLINSIEVLTPHGIEDRCPTCGRDWFTVTRFSRATNRQGLHSCLTSGRSASGMNARGALPKPPSSTG